MTQYKSQSTERSTAGLALVLLLCLPGCPNGDDDDSAEAPLCTVEVWKTDGDGNRLDTAPDHSFTSDAQGRLLNRVTSGGAVKPLLVYVEGQLTATALATIRPDGSRSSFVFEDGQLVGFANEHGELRGEFTFADGLLVEERYPDSIDQGNELGPYDTWSAYEYDDRLMHRAVQWLQAQVGGPSQWYWNDLEWDSDRCVTQISTEEPDLPMDRTINSYDYDDDGRLETLTSPAGRFEFDFLGECDWLGRGVPGFDGMPYWFLWFGWPIGVCQ